MSRPSPPRGSWGGRLLGAILFYTAIPLPPRARPAFCGIACFAPWVGLGLGGLLAALHGLLGLGNLGSLAQAGVGVAAAVILTGGLHLDGAMDTADGLAAPGADLDRRLAIMGDSRTGAFGAVAAVVILGLKTLLLADVDHSQGWVWAAALTWGRWGQVGAIARYSYLKPNGKGAMHRRDLRMPQDGWVATLPPLLLHALWLAWVPAQGPINVAVALAGLAGTLALGGGLAARLGGHTGDTYGAVVEWGEVLVLGVAAWML